MRLELNQVESGISLGHLAISPPALAVAWAAKFQLSTIGHSEYSQNATGAFAGVQSKLTLNNQYGMANNFQAGRSARLAMRFVF